MPRQPEATGARSCAPFPPRWVSHGIIKYSPVSLSQRLEPEEASPGTLALMLDRGLGEAARRGLQPESPRKRGSRGVPLHTWLLVVARLPQPSPRSQGNALLSPAWASL